MSPEVGIILRKLYILIKKNKKQNPLTWILVSQSWYKYSLGLLKNEHINLIMKKIEVLR